MLLIPWRETFLKFLQLFLRHFYFERLKHLELFELFILIFLTFKRIRSPLSPHAAGFLKTFSSSNWTLSRSPCFLLVLVTSAWFSPPVLKMKHFSALTVTKPHPLLAWLRRFEAFPCLIRNDLNLRNMSDNMFKIKKMSQLCLHFCTGSLDLQETCCCCCVTCVVFFWGSCWKIQVWVHVRYPWRDHV